MLSLSYKPNAEAVLERLRLLYARQARDRVFAAMGVPSAALAEFRAGYEAGYCDYPEPSGRVAFWDKLLRERAAVEDDSVPSAYLSELDQGLYGGVLGGDVAFMAHPENGWISSMVSPLLAEWSELDSLRFDRSHPWFRRYLAQLDAFVEGAAGNFGISHFILIDGLNFCFELVGATRTYMSLLEQPKAVQRAIDFAYELNVAIQEVFFERVPAVEGGTCSNMAQWIPGRIVSESVDPFHMTSVDYFETWGRAPAQRLFDHFDAACGVLHGGSRAGHALRQCVAQAALALGLAAQAVQGEQFAGQALCGLVLFVVLLLEVHLAEDGGPQLPRDAPADRLEALAKVLAERLGRGPGRADLLVLVAEGAREHGQLLVGANQSGPQRSHRGVGSHAGQREDPLVRRQHSRARAGRGLAQGFELGGQSGAFEPRGGELALQVGKESKGRAPIGSPRESHQLEPLAELVERAFGFAEGLLGAGHLVR